MNAIFSTRLYTDPDGFCKLYIDICYSVPKFFVMLKTKYKILACGAFWTNREGRDQKVMNLLKSATRGNSKKFYNPINGLLFEQLKDNKVVSFMSALPLV